VASASRCAAVARRVHWPGTHVARRLADTRAARPPSRSSASLRRTRLSSGRRSPLAFPPETRRARRGCAPFTRWPVVGTPIRAIGRRDAHPAAPGRPQAGPCRGAAERAHARRPSSAKKRGQPRRGEWRRGPPESELHGGTFVKPRLCRSGAGASWITSPDCRRPARTPHR
jgi:hypothetical protein